MAGPRRATRAAALREDGTLSSRRSSSRGRRRFRDGQPSRDTTADRAELLDPSVAACLKTLQPFLTSRAGFWSRWDEDHQETLDRQSRRPSPLPPGMAAFPVPVIAGRSPLKRIRRIGTPRHGPESHLDKFSQPRHRGRAGHQATTAATIGSDTASTGLLCGPLSCSARHSA